MLHGISNLGRMGLPTDTNLPGDVSVKGDAVAAADVGAPSDSSKVWDFLKVATDAATRVYGNVVAEKQPAPAQVQFVKPPTDYSKLFLYGGIAVVSVGVLVYFLRKKK